MEDGEDEEEDEEETASEGGSEEIIDANNISLLGPYRDSLLRALFAEERCLTDVTALAK